MRHLTILLLTVAAFASPSASNRRSYRRLPTGQIVSADTLAHELEQQRPPFPNWDLYWQTNGVYAMWHDNHTGDFYFCTVDGRVCVLTGRVVFYYDGDGVN